MDAEGIMNHPWIKGEDTPEMILKDVQPKLKEYTARKKLQKATRVIMVVNRFKNILKKKDWTEIQISNAIS